MNKKKINHVPVKLAQESKADWIIRYFDCDKNEMDCIKFYGLTLTEASNKALLVMPEDCDSDFDIQQL